MNMLRQCATCPYLISHKIAARLPHALNAWIHDPAGTAGMASPKMNKVVSILHMVPAGQKSVVYSHFKKVLQLLSMRLAKEGVKSVHVDGDTHSDERPRLLDSFKRDSAIGVLLTTFGLLAIGSNMQFANNIVMVKHALE